jgi:hypothetical protein
MTANLCFICGGIDHGDTFTATGQGHNFWSNASAAEHFLAEDRRMGCVRYSSGESTVEGQYVAMTRGR